MRHPLVYLVEAADDICYEIMDLEDAHKLKLLSYGEIAELLLDFFDETARNHILKRIEERLLGIGVDDVIGLSRPDCLLVQLDVLYGRGAEHHTAYDTITHGQCLSPRLCRLVVPQSVLRPYRA